MIPEFGRPVRLQWDIPGLESLLPLLHLERHEFAAVLGQPVAITEPGDGDHAWQIQIDEHHQVPRLRADLERKTLTSVLPDLDRFGDTLNLLHTLARSGRTEVTYQEAETYTEVAERIFDEVANTYPSFGLRNLDWDYITERYAGIERLEGQEFWLQARRWVAELRDAHTAIIPPGTPHHPPYTAQMSESGACLLDVPEDSAAYRSGVRTGWTAHVENPRYWMDITGASPQHRAMIAARRFMEMTTPPRRFTAYSPAGEQASWDEPRPIPGPSVVGTPDTVRISRFDGRTAELLAEELRKRQDLPEITIDIRGNVGGSLVAADRSRRMLINEPGEYGSITYSNGRGSISAHYPLSLTPAQNLFRGKLRVLIDSLTYSAAEDFLHPLVGLPHVTVVGGPTGGGSGRPRTVPLKDGYTLRVSTAITHTADGQPVEYQGISGR